MMVFKPSTFSGSSNGKSSVPMLGWEEPASVNLLNGGLHSGILRLRARYEFYKELGFGVKNQEVVGEKPASRESTLPHQWQE